MPLYPYRAADPDNHARLPASAAARDLFRHTSKTLPPNPVRRSRRRAWHPARDRLSDPFTAADRFLPDALSALQELYTLFFSYLEHALQPLEPLVTRAALRAFILETRNEIDDLTARHTLSATGTPKPSPSRNQAVNWQTLRSKSRCA